MNTRAMSFRLLIIAITVVFGGCEKGDEYTYQPPNGWEDVSVPGLSHKVSRGAIVDGFAPNIRVVDETFGGTLEQYVSANVALLRKSQLGFAVVSQTTFTTERGDSGHRLVFEVEQNGRRLRQRQYYFGARGTMYVVTCSRLAAKLADLDEQFDSSMKTFTLK